MESKNHDNEVLSYKNMEGQIGMAAEVNKMVKLENREDFENLLFQILEPLKPFYSEGCGEISIGHTSTHYENKTIPMEAFARPLWGLVPFWRGGGNEKGIWTFEKIYRKGLVSGTNPESKEYWGSCRDLDQKFVEMAAIAYGILMAPEKIWEPLTAEEKTHLAAWLQEINHHECSHSNWQFFCILTNVALYSVGMHYSKERLELGLERIESYYDGGGWYRDGKGGHKDYYIGFAIQFYSIVYAMFMKEKDRERCKKFEERAIVFGRDFIYWFADNGAAVAYGRSQTYRFAQCAFFSICVAAGIEVFPLPVMKGIITRHLKWWLQQPIFDNTGILTIGYGYPNLLMQESYNAPGSPYWCMKAFACLALSKEHEFWSVKAEPLPNMEIVKKLDYADFIIQRIGGHSYLYTPGRTQSHQFAQCEEKYSKFVYSSKYGFSIARSQKTLEECAPDSVLSFSLFGHIFPKGQIEEWQIDGNKILISWFPVKNIEVKSEIEIMETGHIRRHVITSCYQTIAYDAGFAIPTDDLAGFEEIIGTETAEVSYGEGFCRVKCKSGNGSGQILHADPNTNMMVSKTAIPLIAYVIEPGITKIETEVYFR